MSSNEVAVRDPELDRFARLGQWFALAEQGGKDPKTRGAIAAIRLYIAKELGLPPWAAGQINFIHGQLGGTVELKRGIARKEGYDVIRVHQDAESCTAAVIERATGKELGRQTFTMTKAKKAGLVRSGSAWETYPERMLWARAAGWAMKDAIPEVIAGLVGEDEADEIEGNVSPPPPEPVDLIANPLDEADAEDADFEPVPPSPIDQEEETDSPFRSPAGASSA